MQGLQGGGSSRALESRTFRGKGRAGQATPQNPIRTSADDLSLGICHPDVPHKDRELVGALGAQQAPGMTGGSYLSLHTGEERGTQGREWVPPPAPGAHIWGKMHRNNWREGHPKTEKPGRPAGRRDGDRRGRLSKYTVWKWKTRLWINCHTSC